MPHKYCTVMLRAPVRLTAVCSFAALLSVCSVPAVADGINSLSNTSWIAEDIGGTAVSRDPQSLIIFSPNGEAAGNAGCNRFRATYEEKAEELKFSPVMSTRMLCPETVMQQETSFLAAIKNTQHFRLDKEMLYFQDAAGNEVLRLVPKK